MIRPVHSVEVVAIRDLGPHMRRITVGGASLAQFPPGCESGYVKLLFPPHGAEAPADSLLGGLLSKNKPRSRSYTILEFDRARQELTLDFVLHGDRGPASAWASHARIGNALSLRGPGATKLVNHDADWFLIAGDLSALPAISVNLAKLPSAARGYACIATPSEEDERPLQAPEGVEVSWVVDEDPHAANAALIEEVRSRPWLPGEPAVWFAGEFDAMRAARRYFRDDRGIPKDRMYVSSYWKRGETDEGNKRARRILRFSPGEVLGR